MSKHLFINTLIALQAILLLTSGTHRQQFHQVFSQLTSTQQQIQKLGQTIIIVLSVSITILIFSNNILLRMLAIVLYTTYVCFQYNVVKYFTIADLAVFVREVFVIGFSMIWNIDAYLLKEAEQIKKARRDQAITEAQQQPKQVPLQPQAQPQPPQKKHK